MTYLEKIEKEAIESKHYPSEESLQIHFKYGFVVSRLEFELYRANLKLQEYEKV